MTRNAILLPPLPVELKPILDFGGYTSLWKQRIEAMPQLWVTYEELGRHMDCAPLTARDHVLRSHWPRRKCSDGATRVKLPLPVMDDYIRSTWERPTAPSAIPPSLHA